MRQRDYPSTRICPCDVLNMLRGYMNIFKIPETAMHGH